MAIALDTVGTVQSAASYSYTCTGSDRVLVVIYRKTSGADATAMTYGGVSLTKLGGILTNAGADAYSVWYLIGPASGANTLAITGAFNARTLAISYTGANALQNFASQEITTTTDTLTVTSASGD